MSAKRKYTNATFTKRIDHESGRHRPPRAASEPSVCVACGAVYAKRRWVAASGDTAGAYSDRALRQTVCPACKQEASGEPRGFVFVDGAFSVAHGDEIEHLLRNEARRAAVENPLARIMEMRSGAKPRLTISTTTEHLAQRLGHALEKTFGGDVEYDFSHENKLARVSWRRE